MKNSKGITLITLVLTIVLLIILTFTISINIDQYKIEKIKNNFRSDITALEEEINQYYARIHELPIINKYIDTTRLIGIKNVNDNDEYYVIDINQLDVSLNYGKDYYEILLKSRDEEITGLYDVYIINEQSHTIYYLAGAIYDGKVNYTLDNDYSKIYTSLDPYYNDVSTVSLEHTHVGNTSSGGACYVVTGRCGATGQWQNWTDSNGNITGGEWFCPAGKGHGIIQIGWGSGTAPKCSKATSYGFECSLETLGTMSLQLSDNTKITKLKINIDDSNNYISDITYNWTTEDGTFTKVSDTEINLDASGTYKCTVTFKDSKTKAQYTKEFTYTYIED